MATSSCSSCYRRKLKCDRMIDGCTPCMRAKLPCMYKASSVANGKGRANKRGPYNKHGTMREKQLEHIVQVLSSKVTATKAGASIEVQEFHEHQTFEVSTNTSARRPENIVDSLTDQRGTDATDLGLMLADSSAPLNDESDPIFVEAAMLASIKPTPYISESNMLYLWHVFTDRVEPMTKLVHVTSFTPVMLTAARNCGWIADTSTRILVASIMFAATVVLDAAEIADQPELSKTTLGPALRGEIEGLLSDPAISAIPSLHSLQAIALLLVYFKVFDEGLVQSD
jgi:hypothetical protein